MSYTAADITELDDVQHTRLRPAVNLGLDVLNTALRELVDNAIEEVAEPSHGGACVTITLHADGSVSVADDGRGLPVDTDPTTGKNGSRAPRMRSFWRRSMMTTSTSRMPSSRSW